MACDRLCKEAEKGFPRMKTATSKVKKSKLIIESFQGENLKYVEWPATDKLQQIPIGSRNLDRCLDDLDFWIQGLIGCLVKCKSGQTYSLFDTKGLLRFGKKDMKHLERTQILTDPISEHEGKKWMTTLRLFIG
ncbi:hypothetical protein Hanom_Chr11g01047811 [Helianthus anomalus]